MKKSVSNLWAITTPEGDVVWSRGGSSRKPRLMVYSNQRGAEIALRNPWTKQVHETTKLEIREIYNNQPTQ